MFKTAVYTTLDVIYIHTYIFTFTVIVLKQNIMKTRVAFNLKNKNKTLTCYQLTLA